MERVIQGVRSVWDDGGGDKPCVVLLHGWRGERGSMAPAAHALEGGWRVINVDFPGFGRSAMPGETWGVPDYAQWLAKLLDASGVQTCALVGHSFGGRVAAVFAAEYPDRVTHVVLTGVPGLKRRPGIKARMRSFVYSMLRRLAGLLVYNKQQRQALAYRFGSEDYRACPPAFRPTFVKVVNHDLEPYLGRITAPALLVWGDGDTASPVDIAERFKAGIADARLIVFKGRSHFAYLEERERFNADVAAFLRGEDIN